MKRIAVYAGSFDPITKGHMDIIRRASKMSDKLVIGVLNNPNKKYWFNLKEREELVKKCTLELENVEVDSFEGLLVDFVKEKEGDLIIRGLRAVSDYEYELQLALTNKDLSDNDIETVFLPASRDNLYLSSSLVREVALYRKNLEDFIPKEVAEDIAKKI